MSPTLCRENNAPDVIAKVAAESAATDVLYGLPYLWHLPSPAQPPTPQMSAAETA